MLGINWSNIIICTGLICALLSYAEWAQIPDSLGTHLPLVWNWAKVQKFLVTTYSDLPSGLCALSFTDYIHLPNGISRHLCVCQKKKKKIKWKSAVCVNWKNGHSSGLCSPCFGSRLRAVGPPNGVPFGGGDVSLQTCNLLDSSHPDWGSGCAKTYARICEQKVSKEIRA